MNEMLLQAIYGALGSAALNFSFYMKLLNGEKFDWVKFLKSVSLGAVTGFIATFWGIAPNAIIASPLYASVAMAIENVLKSIIRQNSKLRQTVGGYKPLPPKELPKKKK